MRIRPISFLVVLTAVMSSACSSGNDTSTPATTEAPETSVETTLPPTTLPPTTTTTTIPEPTPGEKYIEFVTENNCASELLSLVSAEIYGSDGYAYQRDWPAIKEKLLPAYRTLADAKLEWVKNLATYTWPRKVRGNIETLIVEETADAALYLELSGLDSWNTFRKWDKWDQMSGSETASIVRAKLGLESNLTSDMNYCQEIFG